MKKYWVTFEFNENEINEKFHSLVTTLHEQHLVYPNNKYLDYELNARVTKEDGTNTFLRFRNTNDFIDIND